ncbi:MAG: N-acetylmuramoyl-L-alanine amidase [Mycolicibacterium neoaurum]|uniref:peptidoglycan recognition protein family protein n=1 Tax=Mycolicibacterium neoaurum TaxID=1795 RepID=UPI002FF606C9
MSGWTGDPTWLADVLSADGQIDVRELGGWRNRGHGDFKDLRGIMFHHTGGPASAESIRDGRPDLAGPLSQLHISRTGVVTVVCAGVAWHAGVGSLPWVPTNMGNWHLIGVECEWPYAGSGVTGPGNASRCPWDSRQIKAMRNVAAAVCRKLGVGADRVTTHKEYAGAAQGKWDPGYFDPPWFRGEVAKDLSGFLFPGEGTPTTTPPPVPVPQPPVNQYAGVLLYRGMSGAKVRALQTRLKRNYSKLVVDGDYGPHTEACVRDYQRLHPPLIADGVVGPATAAALRLEV